MIHHKIVLAFSIFSLLFTATFLAITFKDLERNPDQNDWPPRVEEESIIMRIAVVMFFIDFAFKGTGIILFLWAIPRSLVIYYKKKMLKQLLITLGSFGIFAIGFLPWFALVAFWPA